MNEAQFHELWASSVDLEADPTAQAQGAGALADDFPWVFVAGYQAALSRLLGGERPAGWIALAASEDRSEQDPKPGVELSNGALSGVKTWVAGVDHIRHLVVTAGRRAFLVRADAPGVRLDRRPGEDRFLGALSQGFAELENVQPELELTTDALRGFGRSEAELVLAAYESHVRSRWPNIRADGPRELLAAHAEALGDLPEHWARDQRLVTMYARD